MLIFCCVDLIVHVYTKECHQANFNIVITFTQLLNILFFLIDYQKYLQKSFHATVIIIFINFINWLHFGLIQSFLKKKINSTNVHI